jgi:hypothetical protein
MTNRATEPLLYGERLAQIVKEFASSVKNSRSKLLAHSRDQQNTRFWLNTQTA